MKVGVGAVAPLAFSVARFALGATVTVIVALRLVFAVTLLEERVTLPQLIGGLAVVAAILVARPRRRTIAEPGM